MKTVATPTIAAPPVLDTGIENGLKRLKLSTIRRIAPELLLTARTQRWTPEEFLRTLIDAELVARDKSNTANRMTAAKFPVRKTLAEFNINESSIPQPTHDYLVTLDWIRQTTNLCLIGPAGTGKSHYLIALGHAAVNAGYKVRYFTAIDLVEHLYRATADNTVGKTIEMLCRNDLLILDLCRCGDYADSRVVLLAAARQQGGLGHRRGSWCRHSYRFSRKVRSLSVGWYRPGVLVAGVVRSRACCLRVMSACR